MDFIRSGSGDHETEDCILLQKKESEISKFDLVIGHIEDILIDDEFENLQKTFLEKYWEEFDYKEENKLCYMSIFQEYTSLIETHLEETLRMKMPDFCMKTFIQTLIEKKGELEGEVFEMLLTLSDFLSFKEMVLDYRAVKEGDVVDFSQDLQITPLQIQDEQNKSI